MRLDHLLSKERFLRPSREGRQEPGPSHGPGRSRISIAGYSVGPLSGSPSTAPQGVRNGGIGSSRPHTLLSFEGASPAGSREHLATRLCPNPEPAGTSDQAGERADGPGTLRTT